MRASDVDGLNKKPGPLSRRTLADEFQRLAAQTYMIDSSDSGRKPANARPAGGEPPPLEEARLRQQAIGVKLRHMFDEVVNEPVPDEFLEILRRADQRKIDEEKA